MIHLLNLFSEDENLNSFGETPLQNADGTSSDAQSGDATLYEDVKNGK